ncbi:CaiB/BaiF CoA transferase family protein [Chloroflexota bacterium]
MAGLLEGLRIVSMEQMEAIPTTGVWLADWGADVIKVEPLTGEAFRGTSRSHGVSTAIKIGSSEVKWGFELLNRNKRSLAIDLKKEPGMNILRQLVQGADVFMSNYELTALEKLKLDYATLSQLNPRLIYAFLSGYGMVGPDKNERGYDVTAAWARSGLMYLIGDPGSVPPRPRGGMMDRTIGPFLLTGILGALLHREKTGEGQEVTISLFHSGVWILGSDIQATLVGTPRPRDDRTQVINPLQNRYLTKDDRWIFLAMIQSDLFWPDFCRAIEKTELIDDPRAINMETRRQNSKELISIIDEVFITRTMDEWDRILREHNQIFGIAKTPLEVINDPQALANNFYVDLPHPAGKMKTISTPVQFSKNPASVRTSAPEVGQHTEEILLEMDYSWEDISQLKEQGVIL